MVSFFISRTNVIENDDGFSVEILGTTGIRYTEGGRAFLLDSELLAGPAGLILFSNNIIEDNGVIQRKLSSEEIENNTKMINNIRAAFRFRGFEIQVI